jgi:hypothetical protein
MVVKIMSCQWKQKMTLMGMISDEKSFNGAITVKKNCITSNQFDVAFFPAGVFC